MTKRKFLTLIFAFILMSVFMSTILASEYSSDSLDLSDFGVTVTLKYPNWAGFDVESPNIANVRVETVVPRVLIPVEEELTDEWGLRGRNGIGNRSFMYKGNHYYNVHLISTFRNGIAAIHWGGETTFWRGGISLVSDNFGDESTHSRIDTTGAIIENHIPTPIYIYQRTPISPNTETFFSEGLKPVVEVPFVDWRGEQQEDGEWLLLEPIGGVINYVDEAGNIVLRLEGVARAGHFHEGRAVIGIACATGSGLIHRRWGVIDKKGEVIVPFGVYSRIGVFRDGLSMVERDGHAGRNGRWGFIDRNGNEVVPTEHLSATPFSEGFAAVQIGSTWSILQITSYARNVHVTFGATQYYLDGEAFTQPTMVHNGVAYLPAAYLARRLGFTARWNAETNTTTLTSTGNPSVSSANAVVSDRTTPVTRRIWATFGATRYYLDGERFSERTIVYNGVAYLPAAYLARKLGLTARWDAETNITTLTSIMN